MINFRTDLADERIKDCIKNIKNEKIDGIISERKVYSEKIDVTTVKVINEQGSKLIDKKIGTYITININNIEFISSSEIEQAKKVFTNEMKNILKTEGNILIVGLGNEDTTADSLGPKVIKDLEITRHILKYKPEILPEGTREISAIAPGVLGTTGIETQEILKGIVKKLNLGAIIVIDALASNNISRLLKTIQICDTGIIPGAGVNNKRKEISEDTMGVKVIAVGVPTVVEAATIVTDSINILAEKFEEFRFLKESSNKDKYQLIKTVLEPSNYNLVVMPKEIDELVDNMKEIIANGINKALS